MEDASLPSDPDEYMAVMTISLAMDRDVQVTKMLIVETTAAFLLRTGTREFRAASAMNFEKTRETAVRFLETAGRSSLIADDLRMAGPSQPKLKARERVRLTIPISSGGVPYAKGATGIIVQPTDPMQVREFEESNEHPVKFDNGGLVAVPAVFLEQESAQTS